MPDALKKLFIKTWFGLIKIKKSLHWKKAFKHFNLEGIGKSPSKLDMSRILSINEHYIKTIDENELYNQLSTIL